MRTMRESDYRIQSSNRHLKNILEENYYIELGCINYKVLTRLLNGEEININDCVCQDLAAEGIGQLSQNKENSLVYQLSYLIHLRQKSSSCKIFLTCNIIKYYTNYGEELFAPVVLIPILVDYQHQRIIKSSECIPNKLFLNELSSITGLEITYPDRLNTLTQIDFFSFELAKKTHFELQMGNMLTYAMVEYPDFKGDHEIFDIERSIFETTPSEIEDEYYQTITAVLPTNIYQKYVILKASKGDNFAVDGKIGSGKTYTIINIVADKISKGKKILYVNQDNDAINDFEKELYKHHMGPFVYNFERIYPENYQTEILLPELKTEELDFKVCQYLHEYENSLYEKCHGFTYKKMSDEICILKNLYPNITKLPIEAILEHFEINDVYEKLLQIERNLEKIEPLKNNVWIGIEDYYNRQHTLELINAVKEYEKAQINFNKFFFEFCTRYEIIKPENFNDAHRLISDVRAFSITNVPSNWSNNRVYKNANVALEGLTKTIESLNNLNNKYLKLVINDYCKGDAEDILDSLYYRHLQNQDPKFINQLLSPFSPLGEILNDLRTQRKAIKHSEDELKRLFEWEIVPNDCYSFFNKMDHLLSHNSIQASWLKMLASERTKQYDLNTSLENLIEMSQALHDDILQYVVRPEIFKYENLKLLTDNPEFERIIAKNYDRKAMRTAKKNGDKVYHSILEYMDMISEIHKMAVNESILGGLKMEEFCDSYRSWIEFSKQLNENEYKYLTILVEKNDIRYLLKNDNLLHIISDFNEQTEALEKIFNHMLMYGIHLDGEGVLEKLLGISEWVDYLKRVIKCKEQLYKIFNNNVSITYKDLIELVNMDREYNNLFQTTEEKDEYYSSLLGDAYKGLYTNCDEIRILMEHFEAFQDKLVSKRHITSLLSSFGFKQMVAEYTDLDILSERVIQSHRQFSRFFHGGKPELLECQLDKSVTIIHNYIKKISQIEPMFEILESLRYFEKLGLESLVKGIKSSTYVELLPERYLYSTFEMYRDMIIENHPVLKNPFEIIEYLEKANLAEQNYCLNNISKMAKLIINQEKKTKERNYNIHFNEYNKIMEYETRHCQVYLANVDVFNSDLIITDFDTIIIDDCHIASSNKYHRIEEGNQIILFGDKSFRTSISNSLLNRINLGSIVHYNKRYLRLGDNFQNSWSINNQYIYNDVQHVEIIKQDSIKSMVNMLVHHYYQNTNRLINIIVFSPETRRKIYSELINKLSENYNGLEVIKMLYEKFSIINGQYEDVRYATDVVIFFDDIEEYETSNLELIFRNYSAVSEAVMVVYLDKKNEELNVKMESVIKNLTTKNQQISKTCEGLSKVVLNKMKLKGLNAQMGFGRFDIIIKGEHHPNVGIIIEGNDSNLPYSLLDDYQFYYDEYSKSGWNVFVYFVDDIINNLDKRISEVIAVVENKDQTTKQLSFETLEEGSKEVSKNEK